MEVKRKIPAWFFWVTITSILSIVIVGQALAIAVPREHGAMVGTYPEAYFTAHDVEPYPNLREASEGYAFPSDSDLYGFILSAKTDDSPYEVIEFYRKCYPKSKVTQDSNSMRLETVTPRGDELFIQADGSDFFMQVSVHARRPLRGR